MSTKPAAGHYSAGPAKKEWSPRSFLRLCRKLRQLGYDPHLVVAPRNRARWQTLSRGEFPVPLFDNLSDLATFMYESGAVIANDSCNGHLAPFLGIHSHNHDLQKAQQAFPLAP